MGAFAIDAAERQSGERQSGERQSGTRTFHASVA
jgi:hypothetical protein